MDPARKGGKRCTRDTRATVGTIVGLIAEDYSPEEILDAYPYLEREDIRAALRYAAWRSKESEVALDEE